jgi:hypothetical protein
MRRVRRLSESFTQKQPGIAVEPPAWATARAFLGRLAAATCETQPGESGAK